MQKDKKEKLEPVNELTTLLNLQGERVSITGHNLAMCSLKADIQTRIYRIPGKSPRDSKLAVVQHTHNLHSNVTKPCL